MGCWDSAVVCQRPNACPHLCVDPRSLVVSSFSLVAGGGQLYLPGTCDNQTDEHRLVDHSSLPLLAFLLLIGCGVILGVARAVA